MWVVIGWVGSILMLLKSILPALSRFLKYTPVLVKAGRIIIKVLSNPLALFGLVLTASWFPNFVQSVMQIIGVGLIKIGMITMRFIWNLIPSSTPQQADYTNLTQELSNSISGIPAPVLAVMAQLGVVPLLGEVVMTLVTIALMHTIARLVRNY